MYKIKIKILTTTICFFLASMAGLAQNLDSLLGVWKDANRKDTIRVAAYEDYIKNGYLVNGSDSVNYLCEALFEFAKKNNYPLAAAKANNLIGSYYYFTGKYEDALEYYKKSLAINEKLGNKFGMAGNLNNIGNIHTGFGNNPLALDYFQRALKINEAVGNKAWTANNFNNIGKIYSEQKNFELALKYFHKCLNINEILDSKKGIAIALNSLGATYKAMGNDSLALLYFQRSLAINEKLGNKKSMAYNFQNIGNILSSQGKKQLAMEYYQKCKTIAEKLHDKLTLSIVLQNIGAFYQDQGNHALALENCHKALNLATELGSPEEQQSACQCLSINYKKLGNDKLALKYFETYVSLRDSIYNEEQTKKVTQLEMQYEFDKKEALAKAEQGKKDALAAKELSQQKLLRNIFTAGFVVVLLFAGVFLSQRNRISKEKKRSEELLLNILPEATAKELKEKGNSDAQLIDQVTVLFTDFKGFTALAEKVTPKVLIADLHECFSAFDRLCEKYGIEKIKTIGDAYMAAGGLPINNQTHAQDTVRVALEMVKVIEEGKAKKIAAGLPYFEIRVGVHTGPVVAGIVGIKKFQYDIWGDTVNTASRMESSGEPGRVNVSQSTYDKLKDHADFAFEYRGIIEAKGKGKLAMYFAELPKNNEIIC